MLTTRKITTIEMQNNCYRCSLIDSDDLQEKLDAFCALPPNRVETIRTGDEATVIPFNASPTAAVAVTIFSQGLELSATDIRKEEHLKDFPGASLIIVEMSEVRLYIFITFSLPCSNVTYS